MRHTNFTRQVKINEIYKQSIRKNQVAYISFKTEFNRNLANLKMRKLTSGRTDSV